MESVGNRKPGTPALHVEDLRVSYRKIAALKSITFEVHKSEIVSLLGANGAGKTTMLNAISGAIPVESGEIRHDGASIKGVPPHRIVQKGIVHVPEGRRIFADLSVAENLRVAAYLYESKRKTLFKERLEFVLSLFPRLKERYAQAGGTLSGGEQQMLAIGRALITGGDILLLDEPSMGLAPMLVQEIFDTIVKISQTGKTILLVEQNATMAMEISNYCYVLETGLISFEGEPEVLRQDNDIASAYLG
ncbi:MAG: ABC transporter ATP-binding protein [Planctomycetota bacterium]|jgi:branched-chain amino acid transport system ATP-binding protein|nr:ABC transporter ATP-binding protein [Planctomycetota bacterium]